MFSFFHVNLDGEISNGYKLTPFLLSRFQYFNNVNRFVPCLFPLSSSDLIPLSISQACRQVPRRSHGEQGGRGHRSLLERLVRSLLSLSSVSDSDTLIL